MRAVRHPTPEEIELTEVLQALSDPVRLQIVSSLAGSDERPCGALQTPVSKSTLSHHLKVLREAGLTRTRVDGTHRLVSLREEDVERRLPGLLSCIIRASRGA